MILFPLAIAQIENDDDRAFMENVFLTYRRLFYKVALNYVAFSDADDVINSACERMCGRIPELRRIPPGGLRAYVVMVVRNVARDHVRAAAPQNENRDFPPKEAQENIFPYSEDMEDMILRRALVADVREAIGRLPNREQELMLMKFYQDLSTKEIAEALGITENNTRGILKRARAHIMQDLVERKRMDADEVFQ